MREGNTFILSVSVCLSVRLTVQTITFECLEIETLFLVWWCILNISTSSLSTRVKVKDTLVKLIIFTVGHQIRLL